MSLFLGTAVLIFNIHIQIVTGHRIIGSIIGISNMYEGTGQEKPKQNTSTHTCHF